MSNQSVTLLENSQKGELNVESITALVKAGIVPAETPKSQIQIFAQVCQEKGISPFSKEVYLLAYAGKYSIITGIDGFRKIAARTGQLCGCDDSKFDLKADGTFKTVADFKGSEMPNTCTITVYRFMSGIRCPFTHTAKFSEFSSGKQKWVTMPFQMISKVAEAFALRKAFGDATSGISIEEEAVAISDTQAQRNVPIIIDETETATPEVLAQIKDNFEPLDFEQKLKFFSDKKEWHINKDIVSLFANMCESRKEVLAIQKSLTTQSNTILEILRNAYKTAA